MVANQTDLIVLKVVVATALSFRQKGLNRHLKKLTVAVIITDLRRERITQAARSEFTDRTDCYPQCSV